MTVCSIYGGLNNGDGGGGGLTVPMQAGLSDLSSS